AALPEICALAGGAAARLAEVAEGLHVDAARMRENLDATRGQIYASAVAAALARHIGARPAHERVEAASRRAVAQTRHPRDAPAGDADVRAHIPDLDRLFRPEGGIGLAEALVDRVLSRRPQ